MTSPGIPPGVRQYASSADLAKWLDGAPPLDADRKLRRASRLIDRATLTAVYQTDARGYPTEQQVIEAFRDATCAQVESWGVTGDEHNEAAKYSSASVGGASYTRATGGGTPADRLCDRAADELITSGLLPGYITTPTPWWG